MADMLSRVVFLLLLASTMVAGADAPLPGLRVEAVDAGSVLYVKNNWDRPLAAYLIELVGYPGSSFSLYRDDPAAAIAPGAELKIPIVNMTVGAAPEYVKLTGAIYADGSLAGAPEKSALMLGRRKFVIATTGELVERIQKGGDKAALIASLKEWSAALPPATRPRRNSPEAVNQAAGRELIASACAALEKGTPESVTAGLKAQAAALAAAKP
ncbi:MAG: hypothetical protein IH602_23965 [Bryobacteraceae bacterium]|nr:hypothetical protein [Bryobacteraceae bacterium]